MSGGAGPLRILSSQVKDIRTWAWNDNPGEAESREMVTRLKEETIIFISVAKWIVLATGVGIVTGFSTTVYVKALNAAVGLNRHSPYFFLLMPLGFLLSALLVRYISPGAAVPGAALAIEAVNKDSGRIRFLSIPVEFFASIITIATGGSAGKEGPSMFIGGGLASSLSDLFRFDAADRRKLVICGMCGGFASVFGAPLAGAMYGLEVIAIGTILYEVMLPAFVSGIVSYHVSSSLGVVYFYNPISIVPVFSNLFFLKVIVAGIFFGLCSFLLIEGFKTGKYFYGKINLPMSVKSVLAAVLLIVLTLLISTHPLGLGLEVMESSFRGGHIPWYDFILKIFHTGVTLNFGGMGGKVTPMVFIGAAAGNVFGRVMSMDPAMTAAIGFVSVLAGASNTPVAASILAVELFGPAIAPYAAIACVISFILTGHRSVYPSQLFSVRKSSSFSMELGKELEHLKIEYSHREKSFVGVIKRVWLMVKKIR